MLKAFTVCGVTVEVYIQLPLTKNPHFIKIMDASDFLNHTSDSTQFVCILTVILEA